jgi:5-methyltetrahydrofolate--homocysteine methyltransferase
MRYYNELNEAMGDNNPGCTCWGYMFSKVPHFMWQSDFSAMIGPGMFKEFILPELRSCCKMVENSFYHLDGPGELAHLDMILGIPELKGVQWIPGDGKPDYKHWPEVYKKIRDAGKLIQIFGDLDTLDVIADQLGSAKGIYYYGSFDISDEEKAMKLIEKYC